MRAVSIAALGRAVFLIVCLPTSLSNSGCVPSICTEGARPGESRV